MNDTQQVNSKVPPVPLATEALHDRSASPSSDTTAHAARVDGEKGASGVVGGDRPMDHGDVEKGGEIAKKPATPPDFPEGGLWGWLCVLGATLVLFCTFGYANTFGVFQSYYQLTAYPDQSASNISWVGSIQLFFQFSLGAVSGPLYEKGYFRQLIGTGIVFYVVCLFMTSLCKEFWQVILAQGFGIGIGVGLLFLPSLSVISQYFLKRRAFAIGLCTAGSSLGGICLPIMLNNLIASHGFPKAVQYTGALLTGCLGIAFAIMRPRLPPNKNGPPKASPKQIFASTPYRFLVAGLFCVTMGLFFPIYYLQVFAAEKGLSPNLTFYTLAILNASSTFGRITPNLIADKFGSINMITFMCWGAGIMCFAVFGAATPGGLIAVAIIFGFFSGGYVSLLTPALISLCSNFTEIGIRLGLSFLVMSLAALTGTPITGELLARYGFYAPIVFSGTFVCVGSALMTVTIVLQRRIKGTWKV